MQSRLVLPEVDISYPNPADSDNDTRYDEYLRQSHEAIIRAATGAVKACAAGRLVVVRNDCDRVRIACAACEFQRLIFFWT